MDRYYIGATHESLDRRLIKHKKGFYSGPHFTSSANDWELYLSIEVNDYSFAIRLERKIKSMKSRKYIENLKKYPELVDKLKEKCKSN